MPACSLRPQQPAARVSRARCLGPASIETKPASAVHSRAVHLASPATMPAQRRWTFQEAMALARLPPAAPAAPPTGRARFVSRTAAWLPGADVQNDILQLTGGEPVFPVHTAAFGGHVYAQAVLAACRVVEEEAGVGGRAAPANLGLHTVHGYFTAAGRTDRPFAYEAEVLTRGRTFLTARVDARQPRQAAAEAGTPEQPFSVSSAREAASLGPLCFTALVSFAAPRPHSFGADAQLPPAQARFAAVLGQRPPGAWDPSPPADIEPMLAALGRRDVVGTFPMVDMKKVDMAAHNAGRPLHARRELILYRLLAPLPDSSSASLLVHAYAADRNGLLMAANHLAFPLNDKTATLSNTFVVHTNADAARLAYDPDPGASADPAAWWLQEVAFPRAAAGRAVVVCTVWSPAGVHVATQYQDGLCTAATELPAKLKL